MSITAASLYRDTGNFFRHQLVTIVLMAMLTSLISVMIGQALTPVIGGYVFDRAGASTTLWLLCLLALINVLLVLGLRYVLVTRRSPQ